MAYKTWKEAYEQIALSEKTITWHIDHINTFGNIEKGLRQTGAKYISMDRDVKGGGIKVKFSYTNQGQKNKLTQLVLKHDIDAVDEAKYTNVYNKIKGIKNLSRKDADMIANIDPFILGKVVKALAPFYEDVNEEVISEKIQYKGYPTKYAALHGQLGLKTLAQAKAVDHLIVAGGKKPDQIAKIFKNFGPSQFQDIVNLLNVSTKPKDLKDTEKKLKAGFHHESVKESVTDFILDEGMVDIEKARKLPDKIQKQILDLKKEYDRTWDGVFVPMGKEGSSQRKEYERRGKLFKAASKKYKDFLKKHKVANFK